MGFNLAFKGLNPRLRNKGTKLTTSDPHFTGYWNSVLCTFFLNIQGHCRKMQYKCNIDVIYLYCSIDVCYKFGYYVFWKGTSLTCTFFNVLLINVTILEHWITRQNWHLCCVMSGRPSVRMDQAGSVWTDFHSIWHLSICRKTIEEIQVSLTYDKNNRYCTWRPIHNFWSHLAQFFLEWEMFQKKVVEKIPIHILCSLFFQKIVPFVR